MKDRSPWRWRKSAIAGGLVLLLAGFLWMLLAHRPASRVRMPDGRVATVLGVTSGMYHVKPGQRWTKALKVLPPSWQERFGLKDLAYRGRTVGTGEECLVAWIDLERWRSDDPFALYLADESGFQTRCEFDNLWFSGEFSLFNYPRRDDLLRLHPVYGSPGNLADPKTPGQLQSFSPILIRNPSRKEAPFWKPQATPTAWREDRSEVTLVRLSVEPSRLVQHSKYEELLYPGSVASAEFTVREGGDLSTKWSLRTVGVSDATGNEAWLGVANLGSELGLQHVGQGAYRVLFVWPLWSTESAWKLRLRFRHVPSAPLETNEHMWIRDIPVPSTDTQSALHVLTNINGTDLEVVALTGDQAPERPVFGTDSDLTWLEVKTLQMPKRHALSVVLFAREGTAIESARDYAEEKFGFRIPSGTRTVNARIGVVRERWAEFVVRPEFLSQASDH